MLAAKKRELSEEASSPLLSLSLLSPPHRSLVSLKFDPLPLNILQGMPPITHTSFTSSTADGGHEGRVTKGSLGEVEFSIFQLGDMTL